MHLLQTVSYDPWNWGGGGGGGGGMYDYFSTDSTHKSVTATLHNNHLAELKIPRELAVGYSLSPREGRQAMTPIKSGFLN